MLITYPWLVSTTPLIGCILLLDTQNNNKNIDPRTIDIGMELITNLEKSYKELLSGCNGELIITNCSQEREKIRDYFIAHFEQDQIRYCDRQGEYKKEVIIDCLEFEITINNHKTDEEVLTHVSKLLSRIKELIDRQTGICLIRGGESGGD